MIKFYSLFWLLSLNCILLNAQAPQGINYQGVAQDVSGTPIKSKLIGMRLSIVKDSQNGTVEYSERHEVTTNPFGLFTLVIGKGTTLNGNFAYVSWADGNKWVKVEMDLDGGINYQLAGHQQLMSVPFALYSQYSGSGYVAGAGISISNNTIVNTGDASSTNELQTLSFNASNNNLTISGGNTVNITQTFGQVLNQGNDAGGRIIANVGTPATSSDVTTKGYVDTAIAARYAFKVSYAFNNPGSLVSNQQVSFSGENFDDFDVVASNQFTVPQGGAGVYIFYIDGTSNNSAVGLKMRLNYNNSNLFPVKRQASFPNLLVINDLQTVTLKLSDGDIVDLVVDSNGAGDYVTGFFFGNKL